MLTRFEYARVLGARSLQVALGAPILIDIPDTVDKQDPLAIAKYELDNKAVPMIIVRHYPNGKIERIDLISDNE